MTTPYHNQKGIAALEFAMILPIFVVMTFGVIDMGLLLQERMALAAASRVGARAGIVLDDPRPTQGDIETVVESSLTQHGIDPATTTIAVIGAGGTFGNDLSVSVSRNYTFLMLSSFVPGIPDVLPLTAVTVMKLE